MQTHAAGEKRKRKGVKREREGKIACIADFTDTGLACTPQITSNVNITNCF